MDPIVTRCDLLTAGWTPRAIAAAAHRGDLRRVRRGWYAEPGAPDALVRAVRVGGRATCTTELRLREIWVIDGPQVHVRMPPNASRFRARIGATGSDHPEEVRHWRRMVAPHRATPTRVGLVDALVDAAGCLPRRHFRASVVDALRRGGLSAAELGDLCASLPRARRRMLDGLDLACESGLETIVRDIALDLGFRVRTQVAFFGVGRVDLEIERAVVVEADGAEFHRDRARDLRRDARLAALGRASLRFSYVQIVFEPEVVARAIIGAVGAHRSVRNSGRILARARRRAASADLA